MIILNEKQNDERTDARSFTTLPNPLSTVVWVSIIQSFSIWSIQKMTNNLQRWINTSQYGKLFLNGLARRDSPLYQSQISRSDLRGKTNGAEGGGERRDGAGVKRWAGGRFQLEADLGGYTHH